MAYRGLFWVDPEDFVSTRGIFAAEVSVDAVTRDASWWRTWSVSTQGNISFLVTINLTSKNQRCTHWYKTYKHIHPHVLLRARLKMRLVSCIRPWESLPVRQCCSIWSMPNRLKHTEVTCSCQPAPLSSVHLNIITAQTTATQQERHHQRDSLFLSKRFTIFHETKYIYGKPGWSCTYYRISASNSPLNKSPSRWTPSLRANIEKITPFLD